MEPRRAAILLATLPFVLLLSASVYGSYERKSERTVTEVLLDQARTKAQLLDGEYRNLQRAYMLLRHGEDRIISSSLLRDYFSMRFDSLQSEYRDLAERMTQLQEGVTLLRTRLASTGRKAVHVDLSSQMASLIERGRLIAQYPVSSGALNTPTPKGTFEIHRKQTLRVSNLDVPYRMPYYMAFTPNESHGFHALPYLGKNPESSDYWQEARSHIGIPVSHGCIRLLPEEAEKVYEWVEVGTKVYISA